MSPQELAARELRDMANYLRAIASDYQNLADRDLEKSPEASNTARILGIGHRGAAVHCDRRAREIELT